MSACKYLFSRATTEDSYFYKQFWSVKVPLKISIFAWKAVMNKIPTKENLIKRGVVINDSMNYPLCNMDIDSSRHLFFDCPVVYKVWMNCYKWFNLRDHFIQDKCFFRSIKGLDEWRCIQVFYSMDNLEMQE